MKYLVTGGAGFIGSNIVKELLNRGEEVRVLDNFTTGKRENIRQFASDGHFRLIEGDLTSFHVVREAVRGVDYILHQGALPSVPRSVNDPITSNNINILGTLNILEAAKEFGVKRVVYASSSSIYGDGCDKPRKEDLPVNPLSPYAVSKYTAERYCQLYFTLYGLETVSLRYFNVFGPNQDPSSQYSAVIPKFINLISGNRSPVIYGDGLHSRDFTFVANNVNANLAACKAGNVSGEVINIACGVSYTLLELVKEINSILNRQVEPVFEPARKGDVKHSIADISKAKSLLGYEAAISFREGLKRTVESFIPAS